MSKHVLGTRVLAIRSLGVMATAAASATASTHAIAEAATTAQATTTAKTAATSSDAVTTPTPNAAARPDARRVTGNPAGKIEHVDVSATRAIDAVNVQQLANAGTVLQPEALTRFGLGKLADIASLVPAATVQEQRKGVNNITVGGLAVGGIVPSELQHASLVAVYVDDIPVTLKSGNPDLKVLDLERVEVLQGPQGTLFGASAMAGAVRQITQKPETSDLLGLAEPLGSRTSGVGGRNHKLRGMVNMPLKGGVAGLRLTACTGNESGDIRSQVNGAATNAASTSQGRAALRVRASRELAVDASVIASNIKGGINDAYSGLAPFTTYVLVPQHGDDNLQLYNLVLDYDMGAGLLVLSTSYLHRDTLYATSAPYPASACIFGGKNPLMAAVAATISRCHLPAAASARPTRSRRTVCGATKLAPRTSCLISA